VRLGQNARVWGLRAVAFGGFALFVGCSNSDDSSIIQPAGPPGIAVTPPASTLGCDNSLVVHLALSNFFLKPPYNCGTQPQCGSVLVTLLETADGPPLASQRAATADVDFDLTALVSPPSADAPNLSQVHFIRGDLYGDSLHPFAPTAGATVTQTISVSLSAPTAADCAGAAGAGAGGAAGAGAGEAGATSAAAGQAQTSAGGEAGASVIAGASGSESAGSGGAEAGGNGGSGGVENGGGAGTEAGGNGGSGGVELSGSGGV
jgi:hypothetical protein